MWTIVRLTFREMINKKLLLLGLILTIVYLGLFALGVHYTFSDESIKNIPEIINWGVGSQILTAGLFVSGMMVSAITILCSVGSLSSDIENGIIQAVAARPISRKTIYIGKYIGLSLVLTLYSLLVFTAANLIVYLASGFYSYGYLQALPLFCLQPLVLLAVTMWGSSFLTTLGNGVAIFMLYSVSLVGGIVEQIAVFAIQQAVNSSLTNVGIVTSLLMPVDSMYRLVNFKLLYMSRVPTQALTINPFATMTPASDMMIIYTALYTLFFLWLGIRVFQRRDL